MFHSSPTNAIAGIHANYRQTRQTLHSYIIQFQLRENRVQIFGWNDSLSGVREYELEIYQMEYRAASGKLVLPDHPVHTLTWQQVGPLPTFELRNAGAWFEYISIDSIV